MAVDVSSRFRRHDLVRVAPATWAAMLVERPDLEGVPHVAAWAERGWPLIVRRFAPGEGRERVPLGLPLPPSAGKRRIGLAFSAEALSPYRAPTLLQARRIVPASWQATLDALIGLGGEHGVVPHPFGSLLWEATTGLPYLTSASDLDVFWPLSSAVPPAGLTEGIARIAQAAPMRLDGEFLLPDGAGIQWREWREAQEGGEVLAKSLDRVEMRSVAPLRTTPET